MNVICEASMKSSKSKLFDKISFAGFFFGVCFLVYLLGISSVKWKLWPYPLLEDAFQAGKAVIEKIKPANPFDSSFYHMADHEASGVRHYDAKHAWNGLTFFSYGLDQKAVLMAMDGKIVHHWNLTFSRVWPEPPHIEMPVSDDFINLIAPYLYPNGDILGIYATDRDTPFGYGLVKMDKDSNLIWKYPCRAHHDADVDIDGNIYVLTHEMRKEKIPGVHVKPPVMDDYIVTLSEKGKEIDKVSVTDAFANSSFAGVLSNLAGWDLWHTNNIDLLDEKDLKAFPFLKKGCVLISMKAIKAIAAIDLKTKKVIWGMRGPWQGQHDPDFLENGNMLIFDNKGHFGEGGRSRVVEFNPITLETMWQYTGDRNHSFFSAIRSSQQRLPNGNTLITESDNGRIFEVTENKEIVWDYCLPYRAPGNIRNTAVALRGLRFRPGELNFTFNQ